MQSNLWIQNSSDRFASDGNSPLLGAEAVTATHLQNTDRSEVPAMRAYSFDRSEVDDRLSLLCNLGRFGNPWGMNLERLLNLAVRHNFPARVGQLIRLGAKSDAKDQSGETPLYKAASSGNLENVQALLAAEADTEIATSEGKTPLYGAVEHGHGAVVELLLAAGARLNLVDSHGKRALDLAIARGHERTNKLLGVELLTAIMKGHSKAIKALLRPGADVNAIAANGWSALHYAASYGQTELVIGLLREGADIKALTDEGKTPLHVAVGNKKNNKDVVRVLLTAGADTEAVAKNGDTPLKLAKKLCASQPPTVGAKKKTPCEKIVELLESRTPLLTAARLKKSLLDTRTKTAALPRDIVDETNCMLIVDAVRAAILSLQTEESETEDPAVPLTEEEVKELFSNNGEEGVTAAQNLLKKVNDSCLLHRAIRMGNACATERLLFAGADMHKPEVEEEDYDDDSILEYEHPRTPLHIANYYNLGTIMQLLLRAAPLDVCDGGSLLIEACVHFRYEFDNSDIRKLLFLAGADVGAAADLDTDSSDGSQIYKAFQGDDDNPAERVLRKSKLLKKESRVIFLNHLGYRTVVKNCDDNCILEGIQWLIDQGRIDLNTYGPTGEGHNVLMCAVEAGFYGLAELVLQAGADPNTDGHGLTPLHKAAESCNSSALVSLLLRAGANPNAVDCEGRTPLHEAVKNHDSVAISLFDNYGVRPLRRDPGVVWSLLQAGAQVNVVDNYGVRPLHEASRNGDSAVVSLLLQAGAQVNVVDNKGVTPLHGASHSGDSAVISMLLAKGADVNAVDNAGRTPLHVASDRGNFAVIQLLLRAGANPHAVTKKATNPLLVAARSGNCKAVNLILQAGVAAGIINKKRSTPLHESGNLDVAGLLLSSGADLHSVNAHGESPLHRAARRGNHSLVEFLLKSGANQFTLDHEGNTALHHAARSGNAEVVRLLLHETTINTANHKGLRPLHNAVRSANLKVVQLLLRAGAQVDVFDNLRRTPLQVAMSLYNAAFDGDIVQVLLAARADVTIANNDGETPLHAAIRSRRRDPATQLLGARDVPNKLGQTPLHLASQLGSEAIIKPLLDAGANIQQADNKGATPLHVAADSSGCVSASVILLLLGRGADATIADNEGVTPLQRAVKRGESDAILLLLDRGADVTAVDNEGRTLLHWAAECNRKNNTVASFLSKGLNPQITAHNGATPLHGAATPEVALSLLQAGVGINAVTRQGRTALHEAARFGRSEVVQLLLDNGAALQVTDNEGRTPLHDAALSGSKETVELLLVAGLDPRSLTQEGTTPLHEAARSGRPEVVLALLRAGADGNAADGCGETPLHCATGLARFEYLDPELADYAKVVTVLIEAGARIDAVNRLGETPLHKVAYFSPNFIAWSDTQLKRKWRVFHEFVVNSLLAANADLNARTLAGETPLHLIIKQLEAVKKETNFYKFGECLYRETWEKERSFTYAGHFATLDFLYRTIKMLLNKGAQVNTRDSAGEAPLHSAIKLNIEEYQNYLHIERSFRLVKVLIDAGASVNEADGSGMTPLSLAVLVGNYQAVALLRERGVEPVVDETAIGQLRARTDDNSRSIINLLETSRQGEDRASDNEKQGARTSDFAGLDESASKRRITEPERDPSDSPNDRVRTSEAAELGESRPKRVKDLQSDSGNPMDVDSNCD